MIRRLILHALVPAAAAAAVLLMPAASASQAAAPPGEPAAYTALAAGDRFTCALAADGTARCWGFDNMGQLGIGDSVGRCEESIYAKGPCARAPQAVQGGRRFTSISAGDEHACAIDEAGDLYCWGHAHVGQPGAPDGPDWCTHEGSSPRDTPLRVPCSRRPVRIPLESRAVAVAAGEFATCVVDDSGRAWCWATGWPADPTLVPLDQPLASISAGGSDVCALTVNNGIRCWRWSEVVHKGAATPSAATNWKAITVGAGHACALDDDGRAYCWGNDADGSLGIGPNDHDKHKEVPLTPVAGGRRYRSLVTGTTRTCAIDENAALYCWGRVAEGAADDECLDSNGVSDTNNDCTTRPVHVQRQTRFRTIAIGHRHRCGISTSGSVVCWGTNEAGQLGNGTLRSSNDLVAVRVDGVSPREARLIDVRERVRRLLVPAAVVLAIAVILFFVSRPVRSWWRAGGAAAAPVSAGDGSMWSWPRSRGSKGLGGAASLGAVLIGWLLVGGAMLSIRANNMHGDVGYGLAMMALLTSAAIAMACAAAATFVSTITLRYHRDATLARVALVLGVLTLVAGAVLASVMFWPAER